jgi:galactose-1-phosphate uridylyltransferase
MRISPFRNERGDKGDTVVVEATVWHTSLDFGILAADGTRTGGAANAPGSCTLRPSSRECSSVPEMRITDLPDLIQALPSDARALADRIFDISATTGRLDPPETMRAWIERSFGSVDAVREQRIVKVTNRVTLQGTLFNGLRASRPLDTGVSVNLEREIEATAGDPFCNPQEGTPADVFGRVRGEHSVTASNVAKYDGFHGVIVFDDHNPLHLTPEKVADYVSVGLEWGLKALETDPEARYPFLMWNCLWRAGGSIIHGHAQVTATRGKHYPKVERLRREAAAYKAEHGSDYFGDLYSVHDSLGLVIPAESGVRAFASLSPVKEKELVVIGDSSQDDSLQRTVGALLESYVRALSVRSFNVAFYMPPFGPTDEDWSGFPTVVYLVDRGSPANRTSDIGAMELYAASVVASDPFRVADVLREATSR